MRVLNKKLWRDLMGMRLQALAIAMVVAGGVGVFIMSLSTLDSLAETRRAYYAEQHFAEVFASLKRAPASVAERIKALPGVDRVDTRVVAYVNLDVAGFKEPVSGHLISLPDNSPGVLNQIYLRDGRLVAPGHDNEVLVVEEFANAHRLQIGDTLDATINGRRKTLTIVGIALSPEYIYQIGPGAMFPDHKRYGVFWMARAPLATAYNMEGAFNNVSMTLVPGTDAETLLDQLDNLIKPYGGIGAYARKDQLSNRFLSEELEQLRTIARVFPVIFFGVAGFLLNVVLSRLISLDREQIAALKAFGYSDWAVGLHYAKLVMAIVAFGVVSGVILGIYMGQSMSNTYMHLYSFPFLIYVLAPRVVLAAACVSLLVALLGAMYAVRRVVRLPPAQAMRPEPPATYRPALVERIGLQHWFSQPTRMILRHIERNPLKSILTTLGIAMACSIIMVSGFQQGSVDYMVEVQYGMSQREDLMVIYTDPRSQSSLYSLQSLQGVEQVEGFRSVPAKLKFGHHSYRTTINGIAPDGHLMRLLDTELEPVEVPEEGVVLTDHLAQMLDIQIGDMLTVEVLEGRRPIVDVPVVSTAKAYLGANAYMQRGALNRLLKEGPVLTGALMTVDTQYQDGVYSALKRMPRIAGVVEHDAAIQTFRDTLAESLLIFTLVTTLLGATISFGVVYNSMRIALSERNRDLASLRVLGFERDEVAYILLGEFALLTLIAIPLGLLIGYGLCAYLASQFATDLYRVPLVLSARVYGFAALVVIISAVISGWMIRENLAHLDMVSVLKTKE